MIVKLTNANGRQNGEFLLINLDHIVSVNRSTVTRENGETDVVTYLFAPPHGTWEVAETPDEIYKMTRRFFS
jgi:hypothetical protein